MTMVKTEKSFHKSNPEYPPFGITNDLIPEQ